MERFNYANDNSYVFSQLGPVVFQNEDLTVFRVSPTGTNPVNVGNH